MATAILFLLPLGLSLLLPLLHPGLRGSPPKRREFRRFAVGVTGLTASVAAIGNIFNVIWVMTLLWLGSIVMWVWLDLHWARIGRPGRKYLREG